MIRIVATRRHILRSKYIKFNFGWGFAQTPWKTQCSPNPPAGFRDRDVGSHSGARRKKFVGPVDCGENVWSLLFKMAHSGVLYIVERRRSPQTSRARGKLTPLSPCRRACSRAFTFKTGEMRTREEKRKLKEGEREKGEIKRRGGERKGELSLAFSVQFIYDVNVTLLLKM